jgi:hypothetical protein
VVDELIAHRQEAGADGADLLSRLLRARDPDTGEAMDVQQVRDEALIFLLAGHETTSTALTFTLHLLGRHPSEQQLVHDELDGVLDGRAATLDDVPALERTAMAIKEAMRLYPPAYALGRLSVTENEIGGYLIPAGSYVVVSQFATHRHPHFWENAGRFCGRIRSGDLEVGVAGFEPANLRDPNAALYQTELHPGGASMAATMGGACPTTAAARAWATCSPRSRRRCSPSTARSRSCCSRTASRRRI